MDNRVDLHSGKLMGATFEYAVEFLECLDG